MTHDIKLIHEGINYLRLMKNGQNVIELSEALGISEERIKDCIAAARAHKDASERPAKVVMVPPKTKVYYDLATGTRQVVEEVKVELLRDVIVHYGEEKQSEFTTMLPVKITIKRA